MTSSSQLVFAHDTCRAIECLFSTAPVEIRQAMFKELKEHTLNMAKSQYAHHYILKVLRHGSKDQRDHIIQCLSGRVVPLMRHKVSYSVDDSMASHINFFTLIVVGFQNSGDGLQRLGERVSEGSAGTRVLRSRVQAV